MNLKIVELNYCPFYDKKMLGHGEKLDLEECLHFVTIIPQQTKSKWG